MHRPDPKTSGSNNPKRLKKRLGRALVGLGLRPNPPLLIRTELRNKVLYRLILFSVILDSDGSSCQRANFNIGASTATTRSWDIYVTQVK